MFVFFQLCSHIAGVLSTASTRTWQRRANEDVITSSPIAADLKSGGSHAGHTYYHCFGIPHTRTHTSYMLVDNTKLLVRN